MLIARASSQGQALRLEAGTAEASCRRSRCERSGVRKSGGRLASRMIAASWWVAVRLISPSIHPIVFPDVLPKLWLRSIDALLEGRPFHQEVRMHRRAIEEAQISLRCIKLFLRYGPLTVHLCNCPVCFLHLLCPLSGDVWASISSAERLGKFERQTGWLVE